MDKLGTTPRVAPAQAVAGTHAAGERIGPFELVRLLGHGGAGEVWLARQVDGRVERDVALKLPEIHGAGGAWRGRFRREVDILARLEHPHIAHLYDAGVAEAGQPWLAMEHVDGATLAAHVARAGLRLPGRLALFRQVLAAVAHAHRHLVVHRDLKPANILVDAAGQVKLLDFGIAKLLDDEAAADASALTRLGGRAMTLRYAAPEQVTGDAITTATDVYALGVILHELLTGESPYRAVREGGALREATLLEERIAMPSRLAPAGAIAGDLDAIVLKALRPEPAQRYASVEEFDADIAAHLERRPVNARAGTWRYLAGRAMARHKLPIAAAVAVLATLVAGLVMVERERRVAVAEKARAERHFASARKLANTFIFDVHDEIEGLAGSLAARKMLVTTSLDYLDSLAGEAGDDTALAYEVASAYRRIGNIQGQPGSANLGDPAAAQRNFEKAKALFMALDARRPDDIAVLRDHLKTSYALARSYFVGADPRWREEIARTVVLAERVAMLPGAGPRDRSRVGGAIAEQAHLAWLMAGQAAEVAPLIRRALASLESLLREMPDEIGVRDNLLSTYQRAADIFAGPGRTAESLAEAVALRRKALALAERGARDYPDDRRYPQLEVENQVGLATDLATMGRAREAAAAVERALAVSATLMAGDRGNVGNVPQRLEALAQAARIAVLMGEVQRGVAHGREAAALIAGLPADVRTTRDMRSNIASVRHHFGAALLRGAEAPGLAGERRLALLREARPELAAAVSFIDEARTEKLGLVPEDQAVEWRQALARCEAGLAEARAR